LVHAFAYQILLKDSYSEMALFLCFDSELKSYLPVGTFNKLANPDFPVPISIALG